VKFLLVGGNGKEGVIDSVQNPILAACQILMQAYVKIEESERAYLSYHSKSFNSSSLCDIERVERAA
jgi:hypothetical protein